jgi:hypothetical protein
MKINGQEIPKIQPKKAIFIREPEPIILVCDPIVDWDKFEEICPEPLPPEVILPGNKRERNPDAPSHQTALEEHSKKKMAWVVLESLKCNNIEWETVDPDDPETYPLYRDELVESGFTPSEIAYLINTVFEASQLETDDLKAMRESFLVGQGRENEPSNSLTTEATNT